MYISYFKSTCTVKRLNKGERQDSGKLAVVVRCLYSAVKDIFILKVILYSYLILKKMNERITDSKYINKYT